MKVINYITNKIPTKWNQWKTPFEMVTFRPPNLAHLHVYGCRVYIQINMLLKKQKLAERAYIRYFIGYNLSNIYRIWNANKNKVIKIKNITFDKNSRYDSTDIDLGQFINKSFIETDLLESIQSNPIKAIEIDLNEKLKLEPHLLESKLYSNIKSSDQITLHVSNLSTEVFTPVFNTPSDSKNNIIIFILFNQSLAKVETIT